jgi:hypothetical protein
VWTGDRGGHTVTSVTTPHDPNQPGQEPPLYPPPPPPPGAMPPPPPINEPEVSAPTEVKISFWIWIVSAVLTALGGLLLFTDKDVAIREAQQEAEKQNTDLTPEQVETVAAALYVLFAVKMRAGRNWARITLTVLTIFGLLLQLIVGGESGLIASVVGIVAVVLMFLPNANAYFSAAKRAT